MTRCQSYPTRDWKFYPEYKVLLTSQLLSCGLCLSEITIGDNHSCSFLSESDSSGSADSTTGTWSKIKKCQIRNSIIIRVIKNSPVISAIFPSNKVDAMLLHSINKTIWRRNSPIREKVNIACFTSQKVSNWKRRVKNVMRPKSIKEILFEVFHDIRFFLISY